MVPSLYDLCVGGTLNQVHSHTPSRTCSASSHDKSQNICDTQHTIITIYSILLHPITLEGRRGTTDEFATIPFHLVLFSAAIVKLAKSIPVHSLILSFHLFSSLPLFLFPFTVPCRIVFAEQKTLRHGQTILAFVSGPGSEVCHILQMAAWIFLRTSSLVAWSLYEMFNSLQ